MRTSPVAHHLHHRSERLSIRRKRIVNARRDGFLIVPFDDPVGYKFLKMPDEHALDDPRNGTLEFAGTFPKSCPNGQTGSYQSRPAYREI